MALSPWHVASSMDCTEVGALLAGVEISIIRAGLDISAWHKVDAWRKVLLQDATYEKIWPCSCEVLEEAPYLAEPDEDGRIKVPKVWQTSGPWWRGHPADEVRLTFERQEIYRWLRASGITDDKIPEALRVKTKPQAPTASQDKPIHHRRLHTFLTLIEGLALEALDGEIPDEPYKTAGILQAVLERHGLKLNDETIAKVMMEIETARKERISDPF